jgi:photosystem II stability/assembly factor-like uncharacterized protein
MTARRAGSALVAGLVLGLILLLSGCTAGSSPRPAGSVATPAPAGVSVSGVPSPPAAVSPTAPRTSADASPMPVVAKSPPQTPYYGPDATSFISATEGWALAAQGANSTCGACARLFHTTDAGRRWSVVATPRLPARPRLGLLGGEVDMLFANRRDGYNFTTVQCAHGCVMSSMDGGRSWRRDPLPAVTQLLSAGDAVYALVTPRAGAPTILLRSAVGSRRWTRLRLPVPSRHAVAYLGGALATPFYLAAQGRSLALLLRGTARPDPTAATVGRVWISTDQGRAWSLRVDPCTPADGGAALISVARDHPDALLVDCYNGEQSSQEQDTQHHLYGSDDGGRSWQRLADPSDTGAPVLLADNGAGHAFLAVASGGADILSASLDGARRWHPAVTSPAGDYGWADLRFVSASTGFVFGPTHYATEHLYRTEDAGRSWRRIPLPVERG